MLIDVTILVYESSIYGCIEDIPEEVDCITFIIEDKFGDGLKTKLW